MFYQIIVRQRVTLPDAACKDDPSPDDWYSTLEHEVVRAKQVCWGCPALVRCLDYAMNNDERFGVWGGLTEEERGIFHKTRF